MAGEVQRNTATRVTVTNNTLTLENFRELTVGRKHNLGTLKLVKDKQGNITGLRCSKHHFTATYLNPSQKLSDAQELREELGKVIDHELKSIFDINKDEFKDLPQSRVDDLTQKQEKLLSQFKKAFMEIEHHNDHMNKKIVDGIQRSTIKTIVELLDGLKKLSADKLLNYDVKTIAKIMVQGGVENNTDMSLFNATNDAYDDACNAVSNASLDALKEAGNGFLRKYFKNVREVGENPDADRGADSKLKAINATLRENGIETLHLDDNGNLAFRQGAVDRKNIEADFKKLFSAAMIKKGYRRLNKALGGNLSKEEVIAALHDIKDKLAVFDESADPAPDGEQFVPAPGYEEVPAPDPAEDNTGEDMPAPDAALEIDGRPIIYYEEELPVEHPAAPPADQQ